MKKTQYVTNTFWKLALLLAAAIWGGSFVIIKDTLDILTPGWLLGIRFALAACIVGILFRKNLAEHLDRRHLLSGMLLGLASGAAFLVQNYGLMGTTPGRNAFLTAVYCILVPFINWPITHKCPRPAVVLAAALAVVGVGLLSLGGGLFFVLSSGDILTLISALLFALHIVLVAHFSKDCEIMCITVVQLAASAIFCLVAAAILEPLPALWTFASGDLWISMAYLVLLASCVSMVVQNVGQVHVEPAQAALLLSFESVFAVIASVIFYGEMLTVRIVLGFASIFIAVVINELSASWDAPNSTS